MNRSVLLLILASVLLSAVAQVVLKGGMMSPAVVAAGGGSGLGLARAIALSPKVVLGLFMYLASAAVWLLVLARIDVGLAYPFVSLGFVVTMLLAWAVYGEVPTLGRIAGTLTICAGVFVLARS